MPQGILAAVVAVAALVFVAFCISWLIHNPLVLVLAVVAIIALVVGVKNITRARHRV